MMNHIQSYGGQPADEIFTPLVLFVISILKYTIASFHSGSLQK